MATAPSKSTRSSTSATDGVIVAEVIHCSIQPLLVCLLRLYALCNMFLSLNVRAELLLWKINHDDLLNDERLAVC